MADVATRSDPNDGSSQIVTVSIDGVAHELHAIWLRDACQCGHCRRPTTNERLLDSTTIPLDLTISSIVDADERLVAVSSDGHEIVVDCRWLREHLRSVDLRHDPARGFELWTGRAQHVESFPRAVLGSEHGVFRWLDTVLRRGAARLHGVDPHDAALRSAAAVVGEIRATNYGVTWEIEATVEPVSAVDSERHLFAHTDLPYREVAPGVQLLLAVVVDVPGGESTLVDGYAVAEQLRTVDPDAWRLLTTTEFSYPFVRDDVELIGRAPIIGLHANGRYHQIRRAPDLVGVPFVATDETPALYAALRAWNDLVDAPENEVRVALRPGDLLAFDNHRMLHGRTAFELGAEGRRRLLGCYLDIEDVRSRRDIAARRR